MKTWFSSKSLILAAVIIFVLGIAGWFFAKPDSSTPEQKSEAITYSTDTPDETKPDAGFRWQGKPEDPKYIRLPTIQAGGYIQNVGIDQNKQVAVPNNIHFAGWFADSVRPGQMGLSIIDGHVDGRASDGIFKHLADLKENDEYTVELGDGSLKRYRVKEVVTINANDAANELFSQNPTIKSQLNLITCGGAFDQQSRQYDKRVIVVSELIN